MIEVTRPVRVTIGRFGSFRFVAGRYIYTGSARHNFAARVARHLRQEKTLRWHIDYLLAAPGNVPLPGFGASDCRAGCGSHLKLID